MIQAFFNSCVFWTVNRCSKFSLSFLWNLISRSGFLDLESYVKNYAGHDTTFYVQIGFTDFLYPFLTETFVLFCMNCYLHTHSMV